MREGSSALVHVIVRIETEELSPEQAVNAPRLHPAASAWRFEQPAGTDGDPPGAGLTREAGHQARVLPRFDYYFARLNVITIDRTMGAMTGVADPRRPWGAASGPVAVRVGEQHLAGAVANCTIERMDVAHDAESDGESSEGTRN